LCVGYQFGRPGSTVLVSWPATKFMLDANAVVEYHPEEALRNHQFVAVEQRNSGRQWLDVGQEACSLGASEDFVAGFQGAVVVVGDVAELVLQVIRLGFDHRLHFRHSLPAQVR